MDPSQPRRLWAGGHRIWRTDNAAVRWQPASGMLSATAKVSALAVHPADSQIVLVGTSEGSIHRNDRALEAGGSTGWPAVRPRDGFVSWIAHDPAAPEVVYASYAGFGGFHIWRSDDGGLGWQPIDGSGDSALPDIPVHCVVVDPSNTARLYVGTDLGVFTSQDGGDSWAVENTGFATAVTEALALGSDDAGTPWLFAFTHGRGAWQVALSPGLAGPRTVRGRLSP